MFSIKKADGTLAAQSQLNDLDFPWVYSSSWEFSQRKNNKGGKLIKERVEEKRKPRHSSDIIDCDFGSIL